MFQNLAIQAALKLLQVALCQFFGFCLDQEDCPDGVCDELMQECDEFGKCTPEPTMVTPQAFDFNPDWSEFSNLVEAARTLIASIKRFLRLESRVG